jgi:hypothetical protein
MGVRNMKRVRRIAVQDAYGTNVRVTVEVQSKKGWRSRESINRIASSVSSGIMTQMAADPQLKTSLDKIRVS